MMKKIKNIICFTGVWIPPALLCSYLYIQHEINPSYSLSATAAKYIGIISLTLMGLNVAINSLTYGNGKRNYGPFDAVFIRSDPYAYPTREKQVKYPPVAQELLVEKPEGVVLGKHADRYVCVPHNSGGSHNTIIIGETGCGKTSTIVLPTLLSATDCAIFAIDIKGELHKKGALSGDEDKIIIDFDDPSSHGYAPFYQLFEGYTNQMLTDTVSGIAYSSIPINLKAANPFWENSARDLLTAGLLFFYRLGKNNLIDIADAMAAGPIEDIIDLIHEESDENSPEHKLISRFRGMAAETLSGINGQLQTALSLFLTDDNVRHMLRDNPLKADPTMLNSGKSIYLSISEHKLTDYAPLLHLIINQTITELERREEGNGIPVLIIIDELARILSVGKIHKLENALETLRSKMCSTMLISQSTSALQRAYSKAEVDGMIQNCPYKCILSASDKDTVESAIRWAGKTTIRKFSYSKSAKGMTRTVSYVEENLIESSELISLPSKGKLIITTPYGTFKINKAPYYKDKYMKPRARYIQDQRKKGGN